MYNNAKMPGQLLHCDRFRQVTREVNVQSLRNCKPVRNELERNDVQKTLKSIHRMGHLNLLGLVRRELGVLGITDDDGTTTTSND